MSSRRYHDSDMNPPKLLRIAAHESDNPTELSLRQAFELLQPRLKPPFSFDIPSPSEYVQLNRAIAYGILTEPHLAKTHLTHLHAVVTDGYDFFTNILLKLSSESYPKLLEPSRKQLLWVTSKLIDTSAVGVDNLFLSLLRQIRGGDFGEPNLWLSAELLRVCFDKWEWLLDEPLVLSSTLYVYLRLLADHYRLAGDQSLEVLKRMEVDFCIRVLRQHFKLCFQVGRDLIRLLQDLVFVPEFRDVWKDLLFSPGTFGVPGFSDISQIYRTRTPSQYFLLRVTFEMEAQLRFLLTRVKWGSQKRYQEWFAKKFLQRPEQETVIADLIRFICCSHHPPNEIIQSNVISRWAVIGWLLKCCRKNYFEASAKLALFYDWLFFNKKLDNIMNIEPAILLMVQSVPKYIDLTHTLLEFLFLLVDNYDIDRKDLVFQGVSMAFREVVSKGVLHSLEPLTTCGTLASSLREKLNTFFPSSNGQKSLQNHFHGKTKFGIPENLLDSLGTTIRRA